MQKQNYIKHVYLILQKVLLKTKIVQNIHHLTVCKSKHLECT